MNLLKNALLFVIVLQVMVLVQLSVIKYGNQENSFNSMCNFLTFNTLTPKVIPLPVVPKERKPVVTAPLMAKVLSPEEVMLTKIINENFQDKVKKSYTRPLRREVESCAKKFLGNRYVWGATGPHTFDCSGFTQKVYRKAGIKIPRVSREQAKVGSYIKYENLQRGDMVFFDTKRKRTGKVNHVGIYLENGKFIHASSGKKKVVITSFDKKRFYKNRFLWGRRIIKNKVHSNGERLSFNQKKHQHNLKI